MADKRTAEVLLGAFQDEMVTRRQFDVKNSKDEVIMTLYFKPITRYARVKAQQLAGPNADALVVSTQLLCQMAEKEDGISEWKFRRRRNSLSGACESLFES